MRSWQSLRISPDAGLDRISALRGISELEMNIIIAKGIHRTIAETGDPLQPARHGAVLGLHR